MRLRQGLLLTALFALGVAGMAGADTDVFSDPAGDVRGGGGADYDVVRVAHGHDGRFLVHTVRTRGPHTDDSPAPEMYIRVGRGRAPDFYVTAGGVHRIGTGEGIRRIGDADLRNVNARTFKLVFRPGTINNPRKYEWRVVMGAVGGSVDKAPGRYVTHVLR
jgi:hypothetical protein